MTTESTELARTFLDEVGALDEIPGTGVLEPGRINWFHGVKAGSVKTPGVFYVKSTELSGTPDVPWQADNERFTDEEGYAAAQLKVAVIGWRDQWFIPGEEKADPPTWLLNYQPGSKKMVEILCMVEGLNDPMVISLSGKNKAQPVLDAIYKYERGVLKQASRMAKRALPRWAFWLPFQNQLGADGKTAYIEATDGDGKSYGSVVTPPALYLPGDAINTLYVGNDMVMWGAQLRDEYADWFRTKRTPRDMVEGEYTIDERPALPAPAPTRLPAPRQHRNVPQVVNPDEDLPF